MQVFELYFNPKDHSKIAESFHYKPQNAYERKIGRLYMVGELSGAEKKDSAFLQNLFHIAKETYYKNTSLSPEEALKNTLKEANEFIKEKKHAGRTSIALLASKNFSLYMGKTGEAKIILLNKEKRKDLSEPMEESSSGLFHNIVLGKIRKGEKLLVLTPEIHDFFKKGKIFKEISKEPLNEKVNKKIGDAQKEKFPNISGVALVVDHSLTIKEEGKKMISEKRSKKFCFKKTFSQALHPFLKIKKMKIRFPRKKRKKPKLSLAEVKKIAPLRIKKKSLVLPLLLLGVVLLGVFTIGMERRSRMGAEREVLEQAKEKALEGREKEDLFMMEEALFKISHLKEEGVDLPEKIEEFYSSLKEELHTYAFPEEVTETEIIGEIKTISPSSIIFANGSLYGFSDTTSDISIIDPTTGEESVRTLPSEKGVNFASFSGNRLLFFSKPKTVFYMEEEEISESKLNLPDNYNRSVSFSSFMGSPYLLEENGDVFRYENDQPSTWIKEGEKRAENPLALAIDGKIFVLTEKGEIYEYYMGELEKVLRPYIFPSIKKAESLHTGSPDSPLFILDHQKERVIVYDKEEESLIQLTGKAFEGIRDIAVTPSGKKMYLLINQKVHLLEL